MTGRNRLAPERTASGSWPGPVPWSAGRVGRQAGRAAASMAAGRAVAALRTARGPGSPTPFRNRPPAGRNRPSARADGADRSRQRGWPSATIGVPSAARSRQRAACGPAHCPAPPRCRGLGPFSPQTRSRAIAPCRKPGFTAPFGARRW